ncbi:terminase small subunit [Pseudomonas sp. Marseille-QA0892]
MATQNEIAQHLDITDRQVRSLIESGVLSGSQGRGGLDFDECRIAYIRYLRGIAQGRVKQPQETEPDESQAEIDKRYAEERLRLTAAQAEGQELKNEVAKRKSVPTDFAMFALSRLASEIGSILDTLPLTLKRKHPELEVRHIESVQRELSKARNRASSLDDRLIGLLNEYLELPD